MNYARGLPQDGYIHGEDRGANIEQNPQRQVGNTPSIGGYCWKIGKDQISDKKVIALNLHIYVLQNN